MNTFEKTRADVSIVDDMLAVCAAAFLLCIYLIFWALRARKPSLAVVLIKVVDGVSLLAIHGCCRIRHDLYDLVTNKSAFPQSSRYICAVNECRNAEAVENIRLQPIPRNGIDGYCGYCRGRTGWAY